MATALVLIDLQDGLLLDPVPPHDGDKVLKAAASLLARARAAGVPVFHVQHDGGPGDPLAKGTPGFAHHKDVAPGGGEPVIVKVNSSSFNGTDLNERLKARKIDTLVIAGMQTEFCVDSTCRSAVEHGYRVILASDAHTTFDTDVLKGERIIAHHNRTLGSGFVTPKKAKDIAFP